LPSKVNSARPLRHAANAFLPYANFCRLRVNFENTLALFICLGFVNFEPYESVVFAPGLATDDAARWMAYRETGFVGVTRRLYVATGWFSTLFAARDCHSQPRAGAANVYKDESSQPWKCTSLCSSAFSVVRRLIQRQAVQGEWRGSLLSRRLR